MAQKKEEVEHILFIFVTTTTQFQLILLRKSKDKSGSYNDLAKKFLSRHHIYLSVQ